MTAFQVLSGATTATAATWAAVASVNTNLGGGGDGTFPGNDGKPYSGAGQMIVVIDGAFDTSHPMLAGRVVEEACFGAREQPGIDPRDRHLCGPSAQSTADVPYVRTIGPGTSQYSRECVAGPGQSCHETHGTMTASIAAGTPRTVSNGQVAVTAAGVAQKAQLALLKVGNRVGWAYEGVVAALDYTLNVLAKKHHVAAVNISAANTLVQDGTECPTAQGMGFAESAAGLRAAGIAVVVAAGNLGARNAIGSWACADEVIAVGASGVTDKNTLTDYSNASARVDLLAPVGSGGGLDNPDAIWGGWMTSSGIPTTGPLSGTSFAAPQVAGAFAVLRSRYPDASVDQLLGRLRRTGVAVADTRSGNAAAVAPRIRLGDALNERGTRPAHDWNGDARADWLILAADKNTVVMYPSKSGMIDLTGGQFISSEWRDRGRTVAVHDFGTMGSNGLIGIRGRDIFYSQYDPRTNKLGGPIVIAEGAATDVVALAYARDIPGTIAAILAQTTDGSIIIRAKAERGTTLGEASTLMSAKDTAGMRLVGIADLNSDGRPDLVLRHPGTGRPWAWWGTGSPVSPFASVGQELTAQSYWSSKDQLFVLDCFIDGAPLIGYRVPDGNTVGFRLDATGRVIDASAFRMSTPYVAGVEFFAASTK
ncbi:S8 family serine peptidase [Diaminobutyricibacter tongyongensis]|uniref:S8 family serine peptidase n=1 Tax=Leifsonia tongyongensis TaxID=1268043 RepID=A0A6L9Y318_9MICO|nr:S8 family serine peptidase [Diaminobutyricibacter tongyongensis]